MPHDVLLINITYDERRNQYRHNGRIVPHDSVRREIDKLSVHVSKEAERIGRRYAKGHIGIAQFETEMRELLRSAHIISASVGKGGRSRMTQKDWGGVGARLRKEYGYLQRLSNNLVRGKVAKVVTPNRAKRYSWSVAMSYHETMRQEQTKDSATEIKVRLITNSVNGCEECAADEARGWVAVEDLAELGTRICGNFCRCELQFSDDVEE